LSFIVGFKKQINSAILSIESLIQNNPGKNVEIIIVQDKSDELLDLRLITPNQRVTYCMVDTRSDEWSRGDVLNYGLSQASGRYVVSWDVSFLCNETFIADLLNYIKEINFDRHLVSIAAYESHDTDFRKKGDGFGNLWVYDRSKINKVNGWRNIYNEDTELGIRLCKRYNLKTLYSMYVDDTLYVIHMSKNLSEQEQVKEQEQGKEQEKVKKKEQEQVKKKELKQVKKKELKQVKKKELKQVKEHEQDKTKVLIKEFSDDMIDISSNESFDYFPDEEISDESYKLAIFSVCTNNIYALYTITALLSYREHYVDAPLFLAGKYSNKIKALAYRSGVSIIDLDLSNEFPVRNSRLYPSECFWWLGVPEKLYDLGFTHCMYVDGDTVCQKPYNRDIIRSIKHIGGMKRLQLNIFVSAGDKARRKRTKNKAEFKSITDILHLDLTKAQEKCVRLGTGIYNINSGAILFNTEAMTRFKLLDKSIAISKKIREHGQYWDGDDSFFALLMISYPKIIKTYLDNFQHIESIKVTNIEDYSVIHLNETKPWNNSEGSLVNYIDMWRSNIPWFLLDHIFPPVRNIVNYSMWWYDPVDNFGDFIGPWLAEKISGIILEKPIHSDVKSGSIYAVGSIISQVRENGIVWGSGISSLAVKPKTTKNIKVKSVRGPLTRYRLKNLGVDSVPQIYGDGAIIMPKYKPFTGKKKKYRLGVIPHYIDYDDVKHREYFQSGDDVLIIDLKTRDIDSIIDQLEMCETTISSSLHGIIISVAYSVPTRWVLFSDKIHGDTTKYLDFFLSLESKIKHSGLIKKSLDIINFYIKNGVYPDSVDYSDLAKYFPLDLRSGIDYNVNDIINTTIQYQITTSLITDILSSCPIPISQEPSVDII